jgi:Putative MetA-pathway of phenol degradation
MRRSVWWCGCLFLVLTWGAVRSAEPDGGEPSLTLTQATSGPATGAGPGTQTATATPQAPTPRPRPVAVPRSRAPEMLGDQPPLPIPIPQPQPQPMPPILVTTPSQPGTTTTTATPQPGSSTTTTGQQTVRTAPTGTATGQQTNQAPALVPGVRGFKIADNDTPRPMDRVYFSFNYFDELNRAANIRAGVPLHDVRFFREAFGLEKTFLDGDASLGFRLPLNSLEAGSPRPGLGGSDTDVGDLSIILKYAFWQDRETGDLLAAGLAVTTPTGPDSLLRGVPSGLHSTTLQPWLGYVWNFGDLYIHGFEALDVPTDDRDVTIVYSDVGVGYFVYRNPEEDARISAVAPTVEVHVNTPLDHRGLRGSLDPAATPDVVNLTVGMNIEFCQRARLAVGVATPVTGPRPFDWELLAQLRWRF